MTHNLSSLTTTGTEKKSSVTRLDFDASHKLFEQWGTKQRLETSYVTPWPLSKSITDQGRSNSIPSGILLVGKANPYNNIMREEQLSLYSTRIVAILFFFLSFFLLKRKSAIQSKSSSVWDARLWTVNSPFLPFSLDGCKRNGSWLCD